jgi:hypothetical protein
MHSYSPLAIRAATSGISILINNAGSSTGAPVVVSRASRPPSRRPAAAHREHLSDKTIRRIAAQVGGEARILLRPYQAAQRHLAGQPLLELGIGLHLGWKVGRVVDKVLGDGIHLHLLRRKLHTRRLHPGQLRAACGAVTGGALHAAQCGGAADHQKLAAAARNEARQHRAQQTRQRVHQGGKHRPPLRIVHRLHAGGRCCKGQIGHQPVHRACGTHHRFSGGGIGKRHRAFHHVRPLRKELAAQRRTHECIRLGDEDALACEERVHDGRRKRME